MFEPESSKDDVLSIHREAVNALLLRRQRKRGITFSESEKRERLQKLRKRRIALAAELERLRSKPTTTLLEEFNSNNHTTADHENIISVNKNSNLLVQEENVQDVKNRPKELAAHMQDIVQTKCLSAAYRLTGISVTKSDNVLGIRFDVLAKACYHCFFEIVLNERDQLVLQLTQHTLPAAVPITDIVQRHLVLGDGEIMVVGSMLDDEASIECEHSLLPRLRAFCQQVYHCCYCYHVRQNTFTYLEGITLDSLHYTIDHLERVGTSMIRFQLHHRLSGIATAIITLQYASDLCRLRAHQPSTVTITIPSRDDDYEEFVEQAITCFKKLPIQDALEQVTKLMAEW